LPNHREGKIKLDGLSVDSCGDEEQEGKPAHGEEGVARGALVQKPDRHARRRLATYEPPQLTNLQP
jgi:hypothetical protein